MRQAERRLANRRVQIDQAANSARPVELLSFEKTLQYSRNGDILPRIQTRLAMTPVERQETLRELQTVWHESDLASTIYLAADTLELEMILVRLKHQYMSVIAPYYAWITPNQSLNELGQVWRTLETRSLERSKSYPENQKPATAPFFILEHGEEELP